MWPVNRRGQTTAMCNKQITKWSKVLLGRLMVTQLVKKLILFYGGWELSCMRHPTAGPYHERELLASCVDYVPRILSQPNNNSWSLSSMLL